MAADVDAWMQAYDNPMQPVVQRVREVILAADPRVTETIKWQSPTFVFKGNIASFNPRSKQFVSLLFHTGAQIPGDHSILEGGGDVARYARLMDLADVETKRTALEAVIRAWCDWKAG
jgi:hypothetical protein